MTCNLKSEDDKGPMIGFHKSNNNLQKNRSKAFKRILSFSFRKEFLARIDRIIEFAPLTMNDFQRLFDHKFTELVKYFQEKYSTHLDITEKARQKICSLCADHDEGARGFIKIFDQVVVGPMSEIVREKEEDSRILLDWDQTRSCLSHNI